MTLEPETPQQTIAQQQKTIRGLYGEIAELTVELGQFRRREQGWIPVISQALTMGRKVE